MYKGGLTPWDVKVARSPGQPAPQGASPMAGASSSEGSSFLSGQHCLHNLFARQLCPDPLSSLPGFKRDSYHLKSFVQRLRLEHRLKKHQGCVNCINFSSSGQLLASGSDDLKVVLWDWARGRVASCFDSGHVANVFQAKFMPLTEDMVLVTAARDGQIRCTVMTSTGGLNHSKRVAHHNDSAHKVATQPDSAHVFLSCGEDGSVLQVDLRENEQRNKILVCKNDRGRVPLYSIFVDPSDYNYFAISGRDQFARIYDRRLLKSSEDQATNSREPIKKYCPHHLENPESEMKRSNITCLVYSHNGKELLCSYNDEDIYLFDTSHSAGSDYIKRYSGHRNSATVKGVNFFGLESEYVVSGSDCGHVFLWGKESEKIVQFMEGDHDGVVNCLEPHPHIPVLATSGLDHDVKIFSPSAPQPTDLAGLEQLVKRNTEDRDTAMESTMDGMELQGFIRFMLRHYRRDIRDRIGIPADESDSDDERGGGGGGGEGGAAEMSGSDDDDEDGGAQRVRCNPS